MWPLLLPVLHQSPVVYEGSGENSWGDGDTGIDLDTHSAAGDNAGDFPRTRGPPSVEVGAGESVRRSVVVASAWAREPDIT